MRSKESYVKHMPGHKNSKGESAPWVICQHDTDKVISSHKTKDEAEKHLRDVYVHRQSSSERVRCPGCGAIIRRDELNLLTGLCHNCTEEERARKRRSNIMDFKTAEDLDDLLQKSEEIGESAELDEIPLELFEDTATAIDEQTQNSDEEYEAREDQRDVLK